MPDFLKKYREKRNFAVISEPAGYRAHARATFLGTARSWPGARHGRPRPVRVRLCDEELSRSHASLGVSLVAPACATDTRPVPKRRSGVWELPVAARKRVG